MANRRSSFQGWLFGNPEGFDEATEGRDATEADEAQFDQCLHEGWLSKTSRFRRKRVYRYFKVFSSGTILYFKVDTSRDNNQEPAGSLILTPDTVIGPAEDSITKFQITDSHQTLDLDADQSAAKDEWIKVLCGVIATKNEDLRQISIGMEAAIQRAKDDASDVTENPMNRTAEIPLLKSPASQALIGDDNVLFHGYMKTRNPPWGWRTLWFEMRKSPREFIWFQSPETAKEGRELGKDDLKEARLVLSREYPMGFILLRGPKEVEQFFECESSIELPDWVNLLAYEIESRYQEDMMERQRVTNFDGSDDAVFELCNPALLDSNPIIRKPADPESLKIGVITWNMNEKQPEDEDLERILATAATNSSILAICTQELKPAAFKRQNLPSQWHLKCSTILRRREFGLVPLAQELMGAIHIAIFVAPSIFFNVSCVETSFVPCGFGGVLFNKGAVGVSMKVFETSVLFVSAHLAAHQKHTLKRNLDYHRISNEMFKESHAFMVSSRRGRGFSAINEEDEDEDEDEDQDEDHEADVDPREEEDNSLQWKYFHKDANEKWHAFDDETNRRISLAHKLGLQKVTLFYPKNPKPHQNFEVRFGRAAVSRRVSKPPTTGMVQVNMLSENTRVVKREPEVTLEDFTEIREAFSKGSTGLRADASPSTPSVQGSGMGSSNALMTGLAEPPEPTEPTEEPPEPAEPTAEPPKPVEPTEELVQALPREDDYARTVSPDLEGTQGAAEDNSTGKIRRLTLSRSGSLEESPRSASGRHLIRRSTSGVKRKSKLEMLNMYRDNGAIQQIEFETLMMQAAQEEMLQMVEDGLMTREKYESVVEALQEATESSIAQLGRPREEKEEQEAADEAVDELAPIDFIFEDHVSDQQRLFSRFQHIFFAGDFNYRIDSPRQTVEPLCKRLDSRHAKSGRMSHGPGSAKILTEEDDIDALQDEDEEMAQAEDASLPPDLQQAPLPDMMQYLRDRDQLEKEMAAGHVFRGFSEGVRNFLPTFKLDTNSDRYDTSPKQRIPAWCDRVVFKPDGVKLESYSADFRARHSDHRPVIATFEASVL